MPLLSRGRKPFHSLLSVLGNTISLKIQHSQVILGISESLLSRKGKPFDRFF